MKSYENLLKLLAACILQPLFISADPIIKSGPDVFTKWIKSQRIMQDVSPEIMINQLDHDYPALLRSEYEKHINLLKPNRGSAKKRR